MLPLLWLLSISKFAWLGVAVLSVCVGSILSFYRNPWRSIPKNMPTGTMISPADGVVSAIEHLDSHEAAEGPVIIIRIFLSVLNVHINRMPCDCVLKQAIYREGKFLDARSEESAKVNESNTLILDANGIQIGLRQVSGKLAKRIICPIKAGDVFMQGQQFGMITLGSTTELILPHTSTVHVEKGDSVRGGLTQLAVLC